MAMIDMPHLDFNQPITSDCLIINGVQDNGNQARFTPPHLRGHKDGDLYDGHRIGWSPKTCERAWGQIFSLTIYEGISVDEILMKVKVPMFATSSHTDHIIYQTDLRQPLALIMGHEGQGVDERLLSQSAPIAPTTANGQESLIGDSRVLCLYEMLRQRRYA